MSIANVNVQQVYTTNGITTSFPIPFAFIQDNAETVTKVYKVNVLTGVKTLQVIGLLNDYTLPHDVATQPTAVVFNAAPNLCDILVTRVMDLAQAIEFISSGKLLLDNIEEGMDILTMLVQQTNEIAQKSIRLHEIDSLSTFDPKYPPGLGNIANAGKVPMVNTTGTGWDVMSNWPSGLSIAMAAANAALAAASAQQASNSASAASASAISAAASAVSAAASAASAILAGLISSGPFAVTDGQAATNITGETIDSAVYKSAVFYFEIARGTTVFSNGWIGLQFINGAWRILEGGNVGEAHGVTWSFSGTTTLQLKAALDVGAGNGTIKFKKTYYAA